MQTDESNLLGLYKSLSTLWKMQLLTAHVLVSKLVNLQSF